MTRKASTSRTIAAKDLVTQMRAGKRGAIARILTELERPAPAVSGLIAALAPHLGGALVAGLTGPPGAGKSTLANALIVHLRKLGRTVGVIAVDPSSPVSGGAILGDRIRMTAALDDDGVFVRSLAARGGPGGLSPAAVRLIDGLDAAGFDIVLLETVGTGQSEIDVAEVADVRIVVAAPGLGDDIQAMKAGLLEIADVLVVNKADREGADATLHQLRGALSMHAGRGQVPVLKASAQTGAGVDELWREIERIGCDRLDEGIAVRRRRRGRFLIARAAAIRVARRIRDAGERPIDVLADAVLSGAMTADDAAARLLGEPGDG